MKMTKFMTMTNEELCRDAQLKNFMEIMAFLPHEEMRCHIKSFDKKTKLISPLGYSFGDFFPYNISLVNKLSKKLVIFFIQSLLILDGYLQTQKSLSLFHKLIEITHTRNTENLIMENLNRDK